MFSKNKRFFKKLFVHVLKCFYPELIKFFPKFKLKYSDDILYNVVSVCNQCNTHLNKYRLFLDIILFISRWNNLLINYLTLYIPMTITIFI